MTDKLVFEADLDNSPILRAFEKVRSEALAIDKVMADLGKGSDLQAAMAQLATAATSSMQVVRQQLKTVETSVKAMQAQLASDAKAAGKALGDGVAAGVQESTGKVTSIVRAQAQWLQAAYEDELKKGVKFSSKDLMDFKAWGVNIGADAKARLRDMAQQASEEVRKATTQAKTEIAGYYDALGTFISNASAKAGVEASAANSRMLLLGPAEVSKATAQAQREIKVHYDALGRVVNAEAQAASVSAEAASRRMLMLDPATVRASTAQAQREVKVHYDALGRVVVASSADAAEAAAAANRRMLMLDPAVTRAATAQAQREIKVHYDALGRVIMTEAAKTAAATEAANRKALMLGAGDVRTAPGQLSSLHAETTRLAAASSKLDEAFSKQALSAKDLHSAYRGLASGFGAMWLTWGAALPLLTGAAVSSGVVQVIKQGAQVDQALQTIRVLSQESSAAVGDLRTQLLELARSGPFGPMEVAEAMKTLSLAGLNAAQVSASIKDVLNLAVAGNTSITQAADVMVSVSTAFGVAAEGYNYIGDVISKTAAVSKASVESVGEAFKTASVIHKQYGASLEDVGVGLAALSNLGIQGSAAGTALRNMYADLSGRSEKASAALKKYNLDLRDQYGNFKDVVTIAQEFDKALSKLDFKDVKNYLHTVFSERGAKPFIELLDQARKDVATARAAGDQLATVYSKLEELRDNIANSAGFAVISAAQMAMTPLNQMKAVASSLQATLVEAFDSVAPVIVAVGEQLRSVFASEEFKAALKTLVVSVAELTQFLVANFDAIVALGKAYLAFKVAQGVGNIFGLLASSAASSAAAIGALASSLPQATNAFSGLGVASSGAAAAAGGLATTVAGVARWLPVVGGIVQVAAGAWMLYEMYTSRAKSSQDSLAGSASSDTYLNKLREETARLNENTEALMRNMTVAELRAEKDKGKARDTMAADSAKELAKAERSVLEARQAVADFDRQNTVVSGSNANYRKTIVNQLAAAESNLTKVKQDQYIKSRDIQEAEGRAIAAAMVNADKVKAKMEADKKAMSGTLGGLKFDPSEVAKHASALKEAHSNELSQIEKFYNTQLSLLDKFNADAGTRLKDELSAGLIEKGEYMARELKLTEQYETQKLQLLDKERAAYEAAYTNGVQKYLQDYDDWVNKHKGEKGFAEQQAKAFETLQQSLANTSRAAETFFEKNDAEKAKAQDTAFTRMHKQTVELQGSIEKLKKDTQNFWEAEEVLSKKAATQAGVEDALRYASPQAAAYISAAAKETEHLTDRVYKYDEAIRQATIDMDAYVKAVGDDANWNDTLIAGYEDRKKALAAIREERSKLLEAIPDRAAEKGKLAVEKYWKDWEADLVKGLTGAVMVGLFDGGKSGAKALRAVIIAELKRPIQVVVQALVQPVMSGINSALGFTGSGGSGSILGNIGTMGSMAQAAAGWLGLGGATAAGIATNVGIGTAAGLTVAEATAAASAAGAAAGSGLMTTLGPLLSAAPYLAAIAGVYMLAKNLDKSGTPHTGGGALYSASGGLQTHGLPNGWSGGGAFLTDFGGYKVSEDATKMAAGIAQSVVGLLDSAASTFGQQAGYAAATAFADDSSSDGAWGALAIKLGDKMVAEWGQWANGPGGTTFSDGAAGSAEYLAKITGDVRTVLNGIDMPDWAKKILNDLPDSATLQTLGEAVAVINKTQTAWSQLGKTLIGFAAMGDDAKVKLTAASGGIDALVTNANVYYENFYSEGERTAATLGSIQTAFAAVNVPMPATREAFRTLVESLQAAADTNPYASAALATVLSLSGAFASVVPAAAAAENATTTLVDTAEEVKTLDDELKALRNPVRSIKDVAQGLFNLQKEGANLQVELWRTYGDSNSIMAANKLQRDIETAGMTAQEIAQYDLNAARRAEIDTIVAARQAIADGVASWEAYFDLFGTPEEKQSRAKARVQAVLPEGVDTVEEYRGYVYLLTEEFGVGSAEVKKATDVARDFSVAFPTVAEVIVSATEATKDLASYQANFYTAMERSGIELNKLKQTFATLGLEMPTTNAGFRALVEAQDLTTTSGITTFNTLMSVQDAFAKLYPMAEEVAVSATVLTTNLDAFHSGFFTAAEQTTLAGDAMTASLKALGLTTLPTTNAEFRDLALGIDTSTESGKLLFNGLMALAGSFAKLYPMAEEVAVSATVLTTNLDAFHSGFFTAAEQTQIAGDNMTASLKALGLTTLPTTNAEFRDLALGIDTSTVAGKVLFNGLMELAGSFAQLHPLVTTVTEVVQTLDDAIASLRASNANRTVEQIANNMLTLEEQVFQLQHAGDTSALRKHILDGLSDVKDSVTGLSEKDLQNLVWSLQDAAQAVQDTSDAAQGASDEMQRAAEAAAAAAQKIAEEHNGLWRQWLTLNGDTAALRALDLAALDPSNRALQEQIWALEDQKKAADDAAAAAEQLKSTWASLSDSMMEEVRRIRGLIDESSGASYASLAAQFAVATAQTRAGDTDAAKLLPGLSQSMLAAYEATATSLVDLQRVRALTANSLEVTAGLTPGAPQEGYVGVVAPADFGPNTPAAQASAAAAAQTGELQALRGEVAALRTALEAVVINTGKSSRLHQRWDDVGIPVTNTPDGAPLSVV